MPTRPKQSATSDLNAALLQISEEPKPKSKPKKKRRPLTRPSTKGRKRSKNPPGVGKLPQKKRTKAEINRKVKVKETTNLAHITKAIVREGGTVPDIGVILGCAAVDGGDWLEELKAKGLSIEEFLEAAKNRADIELIRIAIKAAAGYGYEEESQESAAEYDELGQVTGKYLPGKKKTTKKHQSSDSGLLKFLLTSRMPDYFMERKEIKIDKRVVELKADAEAEIRGFAQGLLKSIGSDVIDAEFVEREAER